MPQTLYYAEMDGEVYGPYALDTIRGIGLMPDILVLSRNNNLTELSDNWLPASDYPELRDSLLVEDPEKDILEENDGVERPSVPSFNSRSTFYIKRGDVPYGPYTLDALATSGVNDDTLVSVDGMNYWYPVSEVSGLLNTLDAIIAQQTHGHTHEETAEESDNESEGTAILNIDKKELVVHIINSIFGIVGEKNSPYKIVFDTRDDELEYIVNEYERQFNAILRLIKDIIDIHRQNALSRYRVILITNYVNTAVKKFTAYWHDEFERFAFKGGEDLTSIIPVGISSVSFEAPFGEIIFDRVNFVDALSSRPFLIIHNDDGCRQSEEFIDSIVGRLFKGNTPRTLRTIVIDLEDLTGLSDVFKTLNRDLYTVVTDPTEARDIIRNIHLQISSIIRNLLVEPNSTLRLYNATHETKEPYTHLVIKNFPSGLHGDTLNSLRLIAKNGPKAGVYLTIMMSSESLDRWDSSARINEGFNLCEFVESAKRYDFNGDSDTIINAFLTDDFTEDGYRINHLRYDNLSAGQIRDIVEDINAKCEFKEDVIISLTDYLPSRKYWWRGESGRQIEIPFGLSSDRNIASLKITQESGQNSAVVIGIPGSGKSVFLHSLILNAAYKYSPDELRMYLIDFSGVEFNAYALGKLPHARVIAPEAEREFGMSILRELEEEGARRMELCRNYNVNNIVELKRVAPDIKIPRLLVIIDEFQKFFDESNDKISQEANAKIHTIIQEFRKFGINLILATQKLPSGSLLPRDLIANRVVFKCAPNDFQTLITWENSREMPRLRTGECIYNSESGVSYDNTRVQGFFASKQDIDRMLAEIAQFKETVNYEHEPIMVFRSGEQPEFARRRKLAQHSSTAAIPVVVPIYLGESIAVNDTDVNVELVKENGNNILIIGGESAVAQRIAYNSIMSAVSAHEPDSAMVVALNGMRSDNDLWTNVNCALANSDTNYSAPHSSSEIENILKEIKAEIEMRRNDENAVQPHIYIVGFDIQNIRAFDPDTSSMLAKPSTAAKLMSYIINNGPAVGVFSILQVDTLAGINRIDSKALDLCNYRIALQMPENTSMKVMDSYAANRLFVFNRPASRFRAYMRDNLRNISVKFKPYK